MARRRPALDTEAQAAIRHWQRLPQPSQDALLEETRWVVIDVETSGLDPLRNSLISVGAMAVHGTRLILEDSFEVILQQARTSSAENILVHGIGHQAQASGTPSTQALIALLRFVRKDPLVAFHAGFDQTVLVRAMRRFLGLRFRLPWCDLAHLCPALFPRLAAGSQSLDHWLTHFEITDFARHNALSDALSTAQLFLIALSKAREAGMVRRRELEKWAQLGWPGPVKNDILSHLSG